jgi:hypothetical protein
MLGTKGKIIFMGITTIVVSAASAENPISGYKNKNKNKAIENKFLFFELMLMLPLSFL